MGNIVGENFDPYVINQINIRQKLLGSINRSNQQLVWENSKTGWVKLISSADLVAGANDQIYIPESIDIPGFTGGSKLAERFVLFNGTANESPLEGSLETYQRAGIGINNPWKGTNAYGLGGNEFGLQPMPGIISATIKTETRGTLKTGTVNIRANNKQQFEIISTLYLRLGYIMLLEWGNNCYYDNNGTFISDNTLSLADGFLSGKYKYNDILDKIEEQRRVGCGNYDALVGKVVNYNWTFNKDGSYNITLIIRSVGDVIEALKVNSLLPKTTSTEEIIDTTGEAYDVITAYAQRDSLSRHFAKVIGVDLDYIGGGNGGFGLVSYEQYEANTQNGVPYPLTPYFKQEYDNGGVQYFVRFGELLSLIEKFFVPNIKDSNINPKLITFDKDLTTNLIATHPKQFPADPRVCIFAKTLQPYGEGANVTWTLGSNPVIYVGLIQNRSTGGGGVTTDFSDFGEAFPMASNPRAGKLMNIYFNMVYVLKLLDDLKDEEGKIILVDFLNTLMKGFCKTTGNYNNITARVDTDRNKIIFIDETVIPGRNSLLKNSNVANFNVYGFETNDKGSIVGGSFIRDLQLQTGITPDLATMITIGATAGSGPEGYVTGQDATMLSNLNRGTKDRIQPQIQSPESTNRNSEEANLSITTVYEETQNAFDDFVVNTAARFVLVGSANPTWNEDSFSNFTNTQVQLLEYETKKETKEFQSKYPYASSPTNGFLPFDLNLTMDGLSGFKIYQKYLIDSRFLPTNYPETMEFIIKGISHTIQGNIWTTNIESLAVPKPLDSKSLTKKKQPRQSSPQSAIVQIERPSPQTIEYDSSTSDLRKAIIRIAQGYIGISEEPVTGRGSLGFNNANFENSMKGVGWFPSENSEWCNWFTKLVWKQAYDEVSRTDPAVETIKVNVFKNFNTRYINNGTATDCPIAPYVPTTFKQMKNVKFGPNNNIPGAEPFVKGKTIIQNGDMVIYYKEYGHIAIASEVDQVARTYKSIDGNWGAKVARRPINMDGPQGPTAIIRVVEPL